MRYGSVLTFPLNITWFYGHGQSEMVEALTYTCFVCGKEYAAEKPEQVDCTEWYEKYTKRCMDLGMNMDNTTVDWPVMQYDQAIRMADGRLQQYGNEPIWYQHWAENPKTIHHILDADGNVIADAIRYGPDPKPDIRIHIEDVDFDWKG